MAQTVTEQSRSSVYGSRLHIEASVGTYLDTSAAEVILPSCPHDGVAKPTRREGGAHVPLCTATF